MVAIKVIRLGPPRDAQPDGGLFPVRWAARLEPVFRSAGPAARWHRNFRSISLLIWPDQHTQADFTFDCHGGLPLW